MAAIAPVPPARGRLVLDTGGLLAWADANPRARAIILASGRREAIVVVPTVVIAQAICGGPAVTPINSVLKGVRAFVASTPAPARQAGVLLVRPARPLWSTRWWSRRRYVPSQPSSLPVTRATFVCSWGATSDPGHPRVQVVPV